MTFMLTDAATFNDLIISGCHRKSLYRAFYIQQCHHNKLSSLRVSPQEETRSTNFHVNHNDNPIRIC